MDNTQNQIDQFNAYSELMIEQLVTAHSANLEENLTLQLTEKLDAAIAKASQQAQIKVLGQFKQAATQSIVGAIKQANQDTIELQEASQAYELDFDCEISIDNEQLMMEARNDSKMRLVPSMDDLDASL